MIVKILFEDQWTYLDEVYEVKVDSPNEKEKPRSIIKLLIFQERNPNVMNIELPPNSKAYLLNNEGKTIDRIN